MVIFVRLLHPENAHFPIDVTLLGIIISVRLPQNSKTEPLIEVTLFEIFTFANLSHK